MKKFNGFTLIEVVIAAAIIALVSATVIVYLNKQNPEEELENNKMVMTSVLELARSYAMSGYDSDTDNNGYGVYVEMDPADPASNRHFFIYADVGGNLSQYDSGIDRIIEEYMLDENVYVDACNYGAVLYDCDIFYYKYSGEIFIDGNSVQDELTMDLKYNGEADTATVSIIGLSGVIE